MARGAQHSMTCSLLPVVGLLTVGAPHPAPGGLSVQRQQEHQGKGCGCGQV